MTTSSNMSSSHMKQKPKTDLTAVFQRLENNEVSTLQIKMSLCSITLHVNYKIAVFVNF